jgi:hypothetical protein
MMGQLDVHVTTHWQRETVKGVHGAGQFCQGRRSHPDRRLFWTSGRGSTGGLGVLGVTAGAIADKAVGTVQGRELGQQQVADWLVLADEAFAGPCSRRIARRSRLIGGLGVRRAAWWLDNQQV